MLAPAVADEECDFDHVNYTEAEIILADSNILIPSS